GATRFTGHNEACKLRRPCEQASQIFIDELVQEQVAGDDIYTRGLLVCQKIENIGRTRLHLPLQGSEALACRMAHNILPVLQNDRNVWPMRRQPTSDSQHELTVP